MCNRKQEEDVTACSTVEVELRAMPEGGRVQIVSMFSSALVPYYNIYYVINVAGDLFSVIVQKIV